MKERVKVIGKFFNWLFESERRGEMSEKRSQESGVRIQKSGVRRQKLMSESVFQKEILKAFKDDPNIKMFRRNCGGMEKEDGKYVKFGEAGQSDLWGWIVTCYCPFCNRRCDGVHFEIELKSAKGILTTRQEKWIDFVMQNNGIAIVLRPIESDPVGLRKRICELLERHLCPKCVEQRKMTP